MTSVPVVTLLEDFFLPALVPTPTAASSAAFFAFWKRSANNKTKEQKIMAPGSEKRYASHYPWFSNCSLLSVK
jgi:hypothetical protein